MQGLQALGYKDLQYKAVVDDYSVPLYSKEQYVLIILS
jgi:hypothetical protein